MRILFLLAAVMCLRGMGIAQTLYFPPLTGTAWETIAPGELGWCDDRIDSLYDLLEDNNTKAFIILKDGKIVLEKYFGTFQRDSIWYWASAGKSLTSCLVGIANQEGLLNLTDPTSQYLGEGWTACTPEQEAAITIWNQITMTTGLDDYVEENHCTLDTCLIYKADPGTRWAYHNAPYTLLDGVIEAATGQTINAYFNHKVRNQTGITGLFIPIDYNNVFFSTPRSMARFGLWMLGRGVWNGNAVLTDTAYYRQMTTTSQALNKSYGYLWWLNGKESYMLPTLQFVFPGTLMPHAPDDMFSALGKNGQYINVVPSLNMVVIRMGNAPDGNEVPVTLNDEIWAYIQQLDCGTTALQDQQSQNLQINIFPNPTSGEFQVSLPGVDFDIHIHDLQGRKVYTRTDCSDQAIVPKLPADGIYLLSVVCSDGLYTYKVVNGE